MNHSHYIPLFEQYPRLRKAVPYISLGTFPTPVVKLDRLGTELGLGSLCIKRDDVSGKTYGGNKVRKLEFILAQALRENKKEVLTFGGAGSNHALATAVYAGVTGLGSINLLLPQHNARYVAKNLLMSHYSGAELHFTANRRAVRISTTLEILKHTLRYGRSPMVIPFGGTTPLGTTGFVNAAFELCGQIRNGELPEPDYLYVALGSMGTAAGLALGLHAAGMKTRVKAVRVVNESIAGEQKFGSLFRKTNTLLHAHDSSFPVIDNPTENTGIIHDFFGEEYALFTREGMEAVYRMRDTEGIMLDGTYTGKTCAALFHDAKNDALRGKNVLFWNTLNSRDFSDKIADIDYHSLPEPFHRYFEEDVQPLDRTPDR